MKPLKIKYRDEDNAQSTQTLYVVDSSEFGADATDGLDTLKDALMDVTAAKIEEQAILLNELIAGDTATANPYDIADKLVLKFSLVSGSPHEFIVPAPLAAMLPNSDTVEPNEVDEIDDLALELVGLFGTEGGDLADVFLGAERRRSRRIQR